MKVRWATRALNKRGGERRSARRTRARQKVSGVSFAVVSRKDRRWKELAQDRVQSRAFLLAVLKLGAPLPES
jgi:hypothetical protein